MVSKDDDIESRIDEIIEKLTSVKKYHIIKKVSKTFHL